MGEASACPHLESVQVTPSVTTLVSRFALRGRADKGAYDAGTQLAESGAVRMHKVTEGVMSSTVHDREEFHVELRVDRGQLTSSCSGHGSRSVCRHAVAAAHALWLAIAQTEARPPRPRSP